SSENGRFNERGGKSRLHGLASANVSTADAGIRGASIRNQRSPPRALTATRMPHGERVAEGFRPNPNLRLRQQVTEVIRFRHYSRRTELAYWQWIKQYIRYFRAKQHPREMGAAEVSEFLSHLATQRNVAASTQNQALNALIF